MTMHRVILGCFILVASSIDVRAEIFWAGDVDPSDPTTWTSETEVYVGRLADGTLIIRDGGTISTETGIIGEDRSGRGDVIVDGSTSRLQIEQLLRVGSGGRGSLQILDGGLVRSESGVLGDERFSRGSVVVDGEGSNWDVTYGVTLGFNGDGQLSITQGGSVVAAGGTIGQRRDSHGAIEINGEGSQLISSTRLTVGDQGVGTMQISGGAVANNGWAQIGYSLTSSGFVRVFGAGSRWINDDRLIIGNYGKGTLEIAAAGLVTVRRHLTVATYSRDDSFINLGTGGMLALTGQADDSISQFLDLVEGSGAIRYWNPNLGDWAHIAEATLGEDCTLEYMTSGDLAGYTVLTVGVAPELPGDFNGDGLVDLADYTVWRNNLGSPDEAVIHSAGDGLAGVDIGDYEIWKTYFGESLAGEENAAQTAVPEPSSLALLVASVLAITTCARRTCSC